MNYRYVIEQGAAQTVFDHGPRERRWLQTAFAEIARLPHRAPDMEETSVAGRRLLTRFFGPTPSPTGSTIRPRRSGSP